MRVTAPVRIDISAGWSDADPFRHEFGGAVLNGAINLRVSGELKGNKLVTCLEKVPANSGLGTSGALRTAYLVVSNPALCEDKMDLLKRVNVFENAIIGQRAGLQDQAAAIFGGVNFWEFKKDGKIKRVEIEKRKARHLQDRIVLVFTGSRHQSSDIHESVFRAKNFMKQVTNINNMKLLAKKMADNIDDENLMGRLISETWELQKRLHSGMETGNMKKLQEIGDGNYLGARATGAGGGGCMIFYTRDRREKLALTREFNKASAEVVGSKVLDFKFDFEGLKILQ